MNDLIKNLQNFSIENFPVQAVSQFIGKYQFSTEELKSYCFYKDNKYARHLVHKEKDFEILIVCWNPGQISPIHGHEGEKCWMRVETGALQISNYNLNSVNPLSLTMIDVVKGEVGYLDGPAEIHSVENVFNEPAVSLHIYAKPFAECDIYDLEDGLILKTKLLYDSIYKEPC